jgi:hypothetical protein
MYISRHQLERAMEPIGDMSCHDATGRWTYHGGGKGSKPPPPPDYAGAAVAQGAANKETAIASSRLNNPNVVNPYGTQTWQEGATDDSRPTLTQTFSPEQQALYEQEMETKGLLSGLGTQGATALQSVVGKNLDLSGAPAAPGDATATRENVYNAMMSRVNQDIGQSRDKANSDLIAAGIRPGTAAYESAMDRINRQETDARQQALLGAGQEAQRDFTMDAQARKDAIAEILASRQTPLNEINALMSGSQVSNPFAMPGATQNANIQAAPLYNAAMQTGQYNTDVWNQQQANNNAAMSGLFSLGSTAAMPFFMGGSDRLIKQNIHVIGKHPIGVNLYSFEYKPEYRDTWGHGLHIGVMADEVELVMPEAVVMHDDGYKMVDYGALNHA